jgi:superfamily II DNA helicase RecQ
LPTTPERISMDDAANQSFSNNMTSVEILKYVFGHQKFRPGQFDAIEALVSGNDTIVVVPTGCCCLS